MKVRTPVLLSVAMLSLAAFSTGSAEAGHRPGHGYYGGGTVYVAPGVSYTVPQVYVNPGRRTVVTTRDYGHCVVRNVTTVDSRGRRVVRRTKYC